MTLIVIADKKVNVLITIIFATHTLLHMQHTLVDYRVGSKVTTK